MSTAAVDAINLIRASQRQTNRKTGERPLWNASPVPVTFNHNAQGYIIPPNGAGKMPGDKVAKDYDGTLMVYDVYGIDPKQAKAARIAAKKAYRDGGPQARESALDAFPKRVVVSSLDIVEHAVRKLATRGVVALTEDPKINEELKEAARAAWTEFRRDECTRILERYDRRKAVFYAQPRNVDLPPPPMSTDETDAFVWLTKYELARTGGDKNRLTCPASQSAKCPFQHQDADVMRQHVLVWHPTMLDYEPDAEEVEPRRKVGRPRKHPEAGAA